MSLLLPEWFVIIVLKAKPKPKAKKAAVKKIKKVEEVVIEEEADAE